jgi:branched-chain amino acid transport system permease protein
MTETRHGRASDDVPGQGREPKATPGANIDFGDALREALFAAVVALIVGVPLVGVRTVTESSGLALAYRWNELAIFVAAVFAGKLALAVRRQRRAARPPGQDSAWQRALDRVAARARDLGRRRGVARGLSALVVGLAVILPFLPFSSRYMIDVGTRVLTYIILGWGLNIVVGLAGLLALGFAAFYAVGAYSYALLALHFGLSFWVCLPLAGLFAAAFGVLLGFPVLRLRGDYLAIVTLGFGEIVRVVLLNWAEVTGGPNGISDIPRPSFFGLPFGRSAPAGGETFHGFFGLDYSPMHRLIFLYCVILALALLTNAFIRRIRRLPLGRAWEALREDEIACRSLGLDPTITKLSAFALGSMFGGLAGAFFATQQGFISPESFKFTESVDILAIVVLGGMGSQVGVVIAAVLLVGGTELTRELVEYRMLAFGAAMVLIMIWRPGGLLSRRSPTVLLRADARHEAAAEAPP